MEKKEIGEVLAHLNKITGFRVSLHGADYSEIDAYPREKLAFCQAVHSRRGEFELCRDCDKVACDRALGIKDAVIYKCRYGLTEAVSPLYNFGTLTGFLMMGQVTESKHTKDALHSELIKMGTEENTARSVADAIPLVDSKMIPSFVKIMTICAQYLTLSNAIPSAKPTVAEMAKKYVFENYSRKIAIKDICEKIGCSKSTLINSFKKQYGLTVNEYITDVRLTEAERMLSTAEMSIGEIALSTGFSDQSYFSKVFFSKHGISPSEYSKQKCR